MRTLADALVYAVAYINIRTPEDDDDLLDDDVGALESIAGYLGSATEGEQTALAEAAERALAAEMALARPRDNFIHDYRTWMEDMFGEPWVGNRREGGDHA